MTARETLAIVLALEALRLEWRADMGRQGEPFRHQADEQAVVAIQFARDCVEAEDKR